MIKGKSFDLNVLVHMRRPVDVMRFGLLVQEGRERFTNGRVTDLMSVVVVGSEKRSRSCSIRPIFASEQCCKLMDLVLTRKVLSKHIGGVYVSSNFAN